MSGHISCQIDVVVPEDRFDRFRRIAWWDQEKLRRAKILVIGAGALGNEILKNLALLGAGNIFVADMDLIEESNLSRSVLYRESDRGGRKAEVAAEKVKEIYPDADIQWFHGDVVYELGLGVYYWADVVIAGVDNRWARLNINRSCWRTNTPWIDGATEILQGVVRVFLPPSGPCYECTLSKKDWEIMNERFACGDLKADPAQPGRVPTTPTTASVIAALECQEAVKLLHNLDVLAGRAFIFDGLTCETYLTRFQIDEDCNSHETYERIVKLERQAARTSIREFLAEVKTQLGEHVVLEFNHEILISFTCASCGHSEEIFKPLRATPARAAVCPACGEIRKANSVQSIAGSEEFLGRTLSEIGVPDYDIVSGRKGLSRWGFELSGDAARVLGPLFHIGENA